MSTIIFLMTGGFLGWGLGANDAANIFGTAVSTRVISYKLAIWLTALAVVLGGITHGGNGIDHLSDYAYVSGVTTPLAAFLVMLCAAITVMLMTIGKFPVSTSQCVIGAILGWGIAFETADFSKLTNFVSAWIITPVGSMVIAFLLCKVYEKYIAKIVKNIELQDKVIKIGFYGAGILTAYSLGANNVANVTAVYAGELAIISVGEACLFGSIAIALGVLTFSKRVMDTVGNSITQLSQISGFLVVLACGITVLIYAFIGIPVSSSQAIIGAVIGAGLINGVRGVKFKVLIHIFIAWFGTPTIAALLAYIFGIAVRFGG